MSSESHIIKQATLNFNFQEAENKLAIPEKVENWFFSKALGEINLIFDELTYEDELVEIEELVIELGKVSHKTFDADLHIIFKNHLKRHLKLKITDQKLNKNVHNTDHNLIRLLTLLTGFLNKGFLSWKAGSISLHVLQDELIEKFEKMDLVHIDPILHLLPKLAVRQRLAYNFSGSFINKLVRVICKARSLRPAQRIKVQHLQSFKAKLLLLENMVDLLQKKNHIRELKFPSTAERANKDITESMETQTTEEKEEAIRQEDIYVTNAGVVLIQPFLQPLFSNLALLNENGDFINETQREKAIWLLHYACTGNLNINEADSVLFKLLCGMNPWDNLVHKPLLNKADKGEVNVVLNSIITYWDVLKNTGIAALRETFLLRNGHIRINRDSVEVIVEQRGVDMLLSHLPWALSHINLPWSSKKFYVQWA